MTLNTHNHNRYFFQVKVTLSRPFHGDLSLLKTTIADPDPDSNYLLDNQYMVIGIPDPDPDQDYNH